MKDLNNYTCLVEDSVEGKVDSADYSIVHVTFRAKVTDRTELKEVGSNPSGHWNCNGDAIVQYEIDSDSIATSGAGEEFTATVTINPPYKKVHQTKVKIDIKETEDDDEEAMNTVGPRLESEEDE
ncbi:MAG: hypothetical protein U9R19_13900 [Bacteroidota bacterium]|nr:hypothetical protein [Bacteroidota bacterium]